MVVLKPHIGALQKFYYLDIKVYNLNKIECFRMNELNMKHPSKNRKKTLSEIVKEENKWKIKVSNKGRIQLFKGPKTYGSITKKNYRTYRVNNRCYMVHSLVAHAFLGPRPSPKHSVDHICNTFQGRSNNDLNNLQYVTTSQQVQKSWNIKKNTKLHTKDIRAIPLQGKPIGADPTIEWTTYTSAADAARKLNLNQGLISMVCQNKRKKTGRYVFRFCNSEVPKLIDGEEWRNVVLPNGLLAPKHRVSNFGRIQHNTGIITEGYADEVIKGQIDYRVVSIGHVKHYVHRLVALAFLGPPPSLEHTTVEHCDKNPSNNRSDNLKWFTMKQQMETKKRSSNVKNRSKPVLARIVQNHRKEKNGRINWTNEYASISDASDDTGIQCSRISQTCNKTGMTAFSKLHNITYAFCWKPDPDLEGEVWKIVDFSCYVDFQPKNE